MVRMPPSLIGRVLLLAALAGLVDAVAFVRFGGFFASFMSGNTTRLGVAGAEGVWGQVLLAAGLLLCFVAGTAAGTMVARWSGRQARRAVLALVALLLALAAWVVPSGARDGALLLLAAAMGAENAVFARESQVRVGLTYMTGTLVRVGQRLGALFLGEGAEGLGRDLLLWAAFLTGGAGGALLSLRFEDAALWIASASAAIAMVLAGPAEDA